MTGIVTVYATFPSEEEARRIARILIEERRAACANILGDCHSIYRWQDAIEEASEISALFKTRAELADGLIARLAQLHSYEVPAAVVWPISKAWPAYSNWVAAEAANGGD